jgi:hypothetical protein
MSNIQAISSHGKYFHLKLRMQSSTYEFYLRISYSDSSYQVLSNTRERCRVLDVLSHNEYMFIVQCITHLQPLHPGVYVYWALEIGRFTESSLIELMDFQFSSPCTNLSGSTKEELACAKNRKTAVQLLTRKHNISIISEAQGCIVAYPKNTMVIFRLDPRRGTASWMDSNLMHWYCDRLLIFVSKYAWFRTLQPGM